LWNIDLTLVDVTKVTRAAYADSFREVTGRPLVQLPQMAGRSEPEAFFDALALNAIDIRDGEVAEKLLASFTMAFSIQMSKRRDQLARDGHVLPGAAEALAAVAGIGEVVQSVLTGSSRPNAELKLQVFGLEQYLDVEVGGYAGSDPFPKGTLLTVARQRAVEAYGVTFLDTVYIADALSDIAAAKLGGARCIALASGRDSTATLREAGAVAVLPDLTDIPPLLAAITAA
jgi:phosphoglycolate phosphatase-like HAD superfamily hydrolase